MGDSGVAGSSIVIRRGITGHSSAHTSQNLPIILAGGGFKHAGHVMYDCKNNLPLSNLFVRMLHQMGIEADTFGTSTGVVGEIG